MLEETSIYDEIRHMELPPDLGAFEVSRLCSFESEKRKVHKVPRLTATQLMDQAQEYLQEQLAQEDLERQQRNEAQRFFDKLCQPRRSLSPTSEKYRLKQMHLEEKYHHVEAQTMSLRRRVHAIRKQVIRMSREKRIICNMLEERGIPYQDEKMTIDDEEPIPSCTLEPPSKNAAWRPPFEEIECQPPPTKKKRSQPRKPPTTGILSPEQREEEERARQRIVSIIDSVFTETARKQAQATGAVGQFIARNPTPTHQMGYLTFDAPETMSTVAGIDHPQMQCGSGETNAVTENGTVMATEANNDNTAEEKSTEATEPGERQFINYRIVTVTEEEQNQRHESTSGSIINVDKKKRKRKLITGEIGGLSYTYLSNEYETDSDDESKKTKPMESAEPAPAPKKKNPPKQNNGPLRKPKMEEISRQDNFTSNGYDFDAEESNIDRTIKNVVLTSARCAEILNGVGLSKKSKVDSFHRSAANRSVAEA